MERDQNEYSKDQWFKADLTISESTRQVLTTYGRIPDDQVLTHVHDIRDKAWAIQPYPCIGQGRFLQLAIGQHPLYQTEILPRMRTGELTYLDLGCAFAQDVRRLVADGVDSSKCYGADLRLDFIELGYELFQDKDTLKSKFIAADIFDNNSPLKALEGKINIVGASSFFHLFGLEEQKTVARAVIKLLSPRKNSLVVGRQVGKVEPGEVPTQSGKGRYRHNTESWKRMWDDVGQEIGVRFEVESRLKPMENVRSGCTREEDAGSSMMEFSVRRLD